MADDECGLATFSEEERENAEMDAGDASPVFYFDAHGSKSTQGEDGVDFNGDDDGEKNRLSRIEQMLQEKEIDVSEGREADDDDERYEEEDKERRRIKELEELSASLSEMDRLGTTEREPGREGEHVATRALHVESTTSAAVPALSPPECMGVAVDAALSETPGDAAENSCTAGIDGEAASLEAAVGGKDGDEANELASEGNQGAVAWGSLQSAAAEGEDEEVEMIELSDSDGEVPEREGQQMAAGRADADDAEVPETNDGVSEGEGALMAKGVDDEAAEDAESMPRPPPGPPPQRTRARPPQSQVPSAETSGSEPAATAEHGAVAHDDTPRPPVEPPPARTPRRAATTARSMYGEALPSTAAAGVSKTAKQQAKKAPTAQLELASLPRPRARSEKSTTPQVSSEHAVLAVAAQAAATAAAAARTAASTADETEDKLRSHYLSLLEQAARQRRALNETLEQIKRLELALGLAGNLETASGDLRQAAQSQEPEQPDPAEQAVEDEAALTNEILRLEASLEDVAVDVDEGTQVAEGAGDGETTSQGQCDHDVVPVASMAESERDATLAEIAKLEAALGDAANGADEELPDCDMRSDTEKAWYAGSGAAGEDEAEPSPLESQPLEKRPRLA